jgi:hypothetical protein
MEESKLLTTIETLHKEATEEAAGKLRDIAETATDKEVAKAAKRALYLLSQKHVLPPDRAPQATAAIENQKSKIENTDALRAFASAYDGAGNRLLIFLVPQPDGGYPLLTNVLINDEAGVKDYGGRRTPRRDVDKEIAGMESGLERGLAIAEIEGDYGRHLLAEAHAIHLEQKTRTPSGFLELLAQVGPPRGKYDYAPVYDVFPPETVRDDQTISHDPVKLFERTWFEPWFFAVEEVWPSLYQLIQTMNSPIEMPESAKTERKEQVLGEAVNTLMSSGVRAHYVRRLEESADILRRREETETARMALYHALQLAEDKPAADVSFARVLVERSWGAAYHILSEERERTKAAQERSGVLTPGS